MSPSQASTLDDPGERIAVALGTTIDAVRRRIAKPYDFCFISQQQASHWPMAVDRWSKAGRVGARPRAPKAEIRSVIYDQAMAASQLAAFYRVVSVTAVEFAEAALLGFREGQIVVPYSSLRCFVERTAHAAKVSDEVGGLIRVPMAHETLLDSFPGLGNLIFRALYGTQRDWMKLANADFRKESPGQVSYVQEHGIANAKAENVLSAVDKLDKRVHGTRLVYEILCEFLHPNVGDLFGSTITGHKIVDMHGTRHLRRVIGLGPKDLSAFPDLRRVIAKMLDVVTDVIHCLPGILDEIETASIQTTEITITSAHRMISKYKPFFKKHDFCPCLSGLKVKDCARV